MEVFKFTLSKIRKKLENRIDVIKMMVNLPILKECEDLIVVIEDKLVSSAKLFNHMMNFNLTCDEFDTICKAFRIKVVAYEELYDYYSECSDRKDRTIRNYHLYLPNRSNVCMCDRHDKVFNFMYNLKRPGVGMAINDLIAVHNDLTYVSSCLDTCLYACGGITYMNAHEIRDYIAGLKKFHKENDPSIFNTLKISDKVRKELIRIIKLNMDWMDGLKLKEEMEKLNDKI
jgi:hypothetical protein